eukprot:5638142-Alexandrium_andersonii.AAC.1
MPCVESPVKEAIETLKQQINAAKTPEQSLEFSRRRDWELSDAITAVDIQLGEVRTQFATTFEGLRLKKEDLLGKRLAVR